MKVQILYFFLLLNTSFLFGQKVVIKTMPFIEGKQVVSLDDPNFRKSSIIFFLPIDNYDTLIWNTSVLNFANKLKLRDSLTITIYKFFFDPGNCDKCGVKVLNKIDTSSNCSIYFPSCFISGYTPKLIDRAISSKVGYGYGYKLINSEIAISQISYKNSPMCIEKPIGESDFDIWHPFIQEVFFPNYSTEEKVEILQKKNVELMNIIENVSKRVQDLEREIIVLKEKKEVTQAIETPLEDKKNYKNNKKQ